MTQHADYWLENISSDFIVGTCQILPESCYGVPERISIHVADTQRLPVAYSLHCGSSAEFYIRPLHSCIDDTDALDCKVDHLAFAEDVPELPNDVSHLGDKIYCYKIVPYAGYPGFVRLGDMGTMNYNWKHKTYEYNRACIPNGYVSYNNTATLADIELFNDRRGDQSRTVRGPAITLQGAMDSVGHDTVTSVWCPQWPKEAQDWPKRPRYCGWPKIAVICEVVKHGCHVVKGQHRECRDDEAQWRLSFSVAEVILLQNL